MDDAARWWAPAAVVGAALVLPFALRALLDMPNWMTVATLAAAMAGAAVVVRQIAFHREQRQLRAEAARKSAPPPPPEPPRHEEHHVPAIPVDSAEPYYRFTLSCTVCWLANAPQHANPRGLAVHAILERARQVTVTGSPTDPAPVQARLAAELGAQLPDRSGQVVAWAQDVALTLPQEDADRLARLTELRKEKQLRDQERELEQAARTYLADEVLSDPGRAMVWWLARHPEQIREAAELLPIFVQLSAAVALPEALTPEYAERLDRPNPLTNGTRPRLPAQGHEEPRRLNHPHDPQTGNPT